MKFPYGISNFYRLITEGYCYQDRTYYLPILEEAGKHLLFLRPRRFGKSLLLSMLENYYDVTRAEEFNQLFGHLAIGNNPTPKHHQYLVMKWDFSMVSPQGTVEDIKQALHDHINGCIEQFKEYYKAWLSYPIQIQSHNAISSFQSLLVAVQQTRYSLYLLIDEYDNFANEVMVSSQVNNQSRYEALLYGEGAIKTIFKAVKAASAGMGLDRVFITGVSPVVLSDMTSGYNVVENISLDKRFNNLCGFEESELTSILAELVNQQGLPLHTTEEMLRVMRTFYNGYCFSYECQHCIYNPTLAWYFLKHFQQESRPPRQLLDNNLAMDRDKLVYLARLPIGQNLLMKAVTAPVALITEQLVDHFGLEELLRTYQDTRFLISWCYFLGILTLAGEDDLGRSQFKIPNLVVRQLYLERLQELFFTPLNREQLPEAREIFYRQGDLQPLCRLLEQRFQVFDNRDYRWSNELTIKTAVAMLLFNQQLYQMISEKPLGRRYADLILIVRPDQRHLSLFDIVMEFKFISLKELGCSAEQVKSATLAELQALTVVQRQLTEAQQQWQAYRRNLIAEYGEKLRLRLYSVVAIGFERLVWVEANIVND